MTAEQETPSPARLWKGRWKKEARVKLKKMLGAWAWGWAVEKIFWRQLKRAWRGGIRQMRGWVGVLL